MKDYLKVALQGAIASFIAGAVGVIFALIKGMDLLHGANRFMYILSLMLVFFSITSNISIFQKRDESSKVFSSKEVEQHMRKRKDSHRNAPKDYIRAVVALAIAMMLETIRFYVL